MVRILNQGKKTASSTPNFFKSVYGFRCQGLFDPVLNLTLERLRIQRERITFVAERGTRGTNGRIRGRLEKKGTVGFPKVLSRFY